ncbi:hypothetical protein JYJ95_04685 [Corallococcus exiguus]|uniref:hypothetical protein n=1 Tax=Corallococcus exiguus TaxID=83462 RepID=UPI001A8FECDD|nr:hypothetical protein [Corallococcus exiguus]MBN8465795.1 hypothetical protein [Corallococcus exiguus]
MSYLVGPRITFAGQFQADVSTVNNDVRYYSNKDFKPAYQERQPSGVDPEGGWWNPDGSGAFRLINCTVRGALWADGTWVTDKVQEPAIGLFVGNALGRSAGKMVDLDPQMQMVSAIWGMGVRLTDGTGPGLVSGDFWPASFRDLMYRQPRDAANGQSLGAAYTSILQNLVWDSSPRVMSRVLEQMRNQVERYGPEAALSIRFSLYKYGRNYVDVAAAQGYTFGNVVGAIGIALPDEPKSFVLGRRFAPTEAPPAGPPPPALSYFDGMVDMASGTVSVDLGNAIHLDADANVRTNLGALSLAVLTIGDTVLDGKPAFLPVGASLHPDQFVKVGDIPYTEPNWLETTAGIVRLRLPSAAALALLQDHPLAIIKTETIGRLQSHTILARETVLGYMVRADEFVQRLNPQSQYPDPEPTDSTQVTLHAAQWGAPFESTGVVVQQTGAGSDNGTGAQADMGIPVPITGWPEDIVTQTMTAFSQGRTHVTVIATDPHGARLVYYTPPELGDNQAPQKQVPLTAPYMDGQIYSLMYSLQETAGWTAPTGQQHPLDFLILHVRDGSTVNVDPGWADVAPILTQYANLYPVMSKRLVDLSNEDSVTANAAIIELAFSLDMNDPNYMPVTRDLSPAKQQTLLAYLRKVQGKVTAPPLPVKRMVAARAPGAAIPVLSKAAATTFANTLKKSQAVKSGGEKP